MNIKIEDTDYIEHVTVSDVVFNLKYNDETGEAIIYVENEEPRHISREQYDFIMNIFHI